MNWMIRLLLWGIVLPILPLEYFMLRDEIKFKKNIVVGVTLPYEARNNEDVKHRLDIYQQELKRVFMLLFAVSVPCWLIRSTTAELFLWGLWLLLVIVLPNVPYARCNRELREIKRVKGWSRQSRDVLWVDTAAIPEDRWLSPAWFVPAVLLCLLPVVWDRELAVIYLLDAVCAFSCWLGYRYLYRNRGEVVDANQDLSQVLSRVRRRNWGRVWLYCAYFFALINFSMGIAVKQMVVGMVLVLLLGLLLLCAAVRIEFLTRRVQEKLTAESGKEWYTDEDDKWIWGLLYYNPHDRRVIVNNRVGVNSSVNLARPGGKVFAVLVVLVLLSLPCMGLLLDGIDSKPLDLQLRDTLLVASYGSSSYAVKTGEIEEIQILDALPQGLRRIAGTGAEKLLKGRFQSPELGSLTLCLDPQCPPFLLVRIVDGRQFLFGTRESDAVGLVFANIGG